MRKIERLKNCSFTKNVRFMRQDFPTGPSPAWACWACVRDLSETFPWRENFNLVSFTTQAGENPVHPSDLMIIIELSKTWKTGFKNRKAENKNVASYETGKLFLYRAFKLDLKAINIQFYLYFFWINRYFVQNLPMWNPTYTLLHIWNFEYFPQRQSWC